MVRGKKGVRIKREMNKINKLNLVLVNCLFYLLCCFLPASAWTVSPVRFEIEGKKGEEYTLTFQVLNESQLYQKRFAIQMDDWIIDENNQFLRKAFTKGVKSKYSATSWIKVTPQQFVVPPGETKRVRFTISVPEKLPTDGDYTAGIFVGERNIEKPPKGEKVIHIKQDTFIGVVVYVKIGKENPKVEMTDLVVKSQPAGEGLSKVTIYPTFTSTGNVHSRGQVKLQVESLTDDSDPDVIDAGEAVILRESKVTYPIDIPEPLKANTEWKFTVRGDFGDYAPILVGAKKYKVPRVIKKKEKVDKETKAQEVEKEDPKKEAAKKQ